MGLLFLNDSNWKKSISVKNEEKSEVKQQDRMIDVYIKFKNNDYYSKDINDYIEFNVTKDSLNQDVVYSNSISFQIEKTDELLPYVKINKEAKGFSFEDANSRASKIKYGFKIIGNQLVLDNYLITELKDKYRDQKVEIKLYLPKGTLFKVNSNVKNYDYSDNSFFISSFEKITPLLKALM